MKNTIPADEIWETMPEIEARMAQDNYIAAPMNPADWEIAHMHQCPFCGNGLHGQGWYGKEPMAYRAIAFCPICNKGTEF